MDVFIKPVMFQSSKIIVSIVKKLKNDSVFHFELAKKGMFGVGRLCNHACVKLIQ